MPRSVLPRPLLASRPFFAVGVVAAVVLSFPASFSARAADPANPHAGHGGAPISAKPAENKPAAARKILYYRNPMGLPDTSPVPKKDTMGMDYVPVYADEAPISAKPAENKPAAARKILYYRNPMGLPDTSPVPKKDTMGMDYVPVYADEAPISAKPTENKPAAARKILYYRNPMGLPDTSPVPKKDSMGMDYAPVYADEAPGATGTPGGAAIGAVRINPDKVQKLGVRTEAVAARSLVRVVRALGSVQVIEKNFQVVACKFEGWIETLHVNTTGQPVVKGQSLMEVYSPELVLAQEEYLLARRSGESGLAEGALQRLRYRGAPEEEISALRKRSKASRTISIRAPLTGVVTERKAVKGMRFMAGETLFELADLSKVWVLADVFEKDIGSVAVGQTAKVTLNAFPGRVFTGAVVMIHPTMTAENRTVKVHFELPNPDGALRPAMTTTVELAIPVSATPTLAAPDSAVLDSGKRQVVLVERGEGLFEPRPVKLGAKADGYVEIVEGLAAGERVVVRASFLIDAESNLRAALGQFEQGK
ncbi:membrane fusion protein, copper/silver efflux system [Azospirillaceae bacterium]